MSRAAGVDVGALDVLERIAVLGCERRGPVVDLLLDRRAHLLAQFVSTDARGRPMIFWQTAKAAATRDQACAPRIGRAASSTESRSTGVNASAVRLSV